MTRLTTPGTTPVRLYENLRGLVAAGGRNLRGVDHVARADDARREARRAERVHECGGCSPSRAVSRGDDSRLDEFGEVAHRWIDAVFHCGARQVEAAQQESDR